MDVEFNEEYNIAVTIKKSFKVISYFTDNDFVYFLFSEHGATKFKNFTIVKVNYKEKESKTYLGMLEKDFYYSKMLVNNGTVHLGGAYGPSDGNILLTECFSALCCYIPKLFIKYKYFPAIINIDMKTKSGTRKEFKMENYQKGTVDFVDMDMADSTDEINFVINHDYKKSNKTFLRTLKANKLGQDLNIKKPNSVQITNSKINTIDASKKIMMGTYGTYGKSESVSQGIYTALVDGNKQVYFKTIPWKSFKNYKVPMYNKEARNMKKNDKKGKPTDILIQIIFHDVIVKDEETIFFGEAYYPRYEQRTTTTYVNGRPTTTTVTVFIGYQYSGALVFALDEKGDLLWDNGFNINGPLTFYLRERFKFYETGDNQYTVVFNEGLKLRAQTLNKEDNNLEIKEVDMETASKNDKVKSYYPSGSDILYWYDDYYLATGRLDIKNKTAKGSAKKRNVFYLNKIELPIGE